MSQTHAPLLGYTSHAEMVEVTHSLCEVDSEQNREQIGDGEHCQWVQQHLSLLQKWQR